MEFAESLKIIQIIGYKNSGKTTLVELLVEHLTNSGIRVGTIKHHGHGGEPDYMRNTDDMRHFHAGAEVSSVQGENTSQITFTHKDTNLLEDMIDHYNKFHLDMVLLEGYKKKPYPKIVLIRREEDLPLLEKVNQVIAVGVWDRNINLPHGLFVFEMEDIQDNIEHLIVHIEKEIGVNDHG